MKKANRGFSTNGLAKPQELAVGDTINYHKPLGGTEKVVVESIEASVQKVSKKQLTQPETVLHLSNGKWLRGIDYLESNKE